MRVARPCGMMSLMTRDWARLAAAIKAAREARGLKQIELAGRAGVSEGTIQNLESPEPRRRIPPSLAKVEPLIGWAEGSGIAVLEGGEPTPAVGAVVDEARADLPLRIVDELQSGGKLIDTAVIPLPTASGVDAYMTVVVRGDPGASPEQIREALEMWRRAERHLQRLDDDVDEDVPPVNEA